MRGGATRRCPSRTSSGVVAAACAGAACAACRPWCASRPADAVRHLRHDCVVLRRSGRRGTPQRVHIDAPAPPRCAPSRQPHALYAAQCAQPSAAAAYRRDCGGREAPPLAAQPPGFRQAPASAIGQQATHADHLAGAGGYPRTERAATPWEKTLAR